MTLVSTLFVRDVDAAVQTIHHFGWPKVDIVMDHASFVPTLVRSGSLNGEEKPSRTAPDQASGPMKSAARQPDRDLAVQRNAAPLSSVAGIWLTSGCSFASPVFAFPT